jgi:triosephosphate isomerase
MRARFVAGNWKMNGSLAANAELLKAVSSGLAGLRGVECAVCVPFPYLPQAGAALGESALKLGAQTLSEHASGAYTGEVSAAMLVEFGCRYVLVGHSERRALFGETDAQVAAKFLAAAKAGLVPLLCVGESLQEREAGQTEQVVGRQLDAVMDAAGVQALEGAVLAYEPVWAIGTGRTASPQQAQDVHAFLRARVAARDAKVAKAVRILYGGSVKASNAAEIFAMADVDGGLIGGASLVANDFLAICSAARKE